MKSFPLAPLAILFLIAPSACGGNGRDGESADRARHVSVSVSPASASVELRQSQQFSAQVRGTPHADVTWSVNGIAGGNSTVGTVDSSGFYTAPSSVPVSSITVRAVSVVHPRASASAAVLVVRPRAVSVTISPDSVGLLPGQRQQFSAWVSGAANTAVNWSVNGTRGGSATLGKITSDGLYTAPSGAPGGSVTVTARSIYDSADYASARVAVKAHQVSLSWSANPSNVVGYNVYRSTKSRTGYARITPAPDAETLYTDDNVSSGRTYFYAVTAVDSDGAESGYSNVVKATIP